MEIYEYEKNMDGYIKWLKDLSKIDLELAKEIARKSLIELSVSNELGSDKVQPFDYSKKVVFDKQKNKIRKINK